jgi:hypothetical protein
MDWEGGSLLQHSQIILYSSSLPYVLSVILSYSLSLDSDCLSLPSFCLFKDDLKLSTQILTCSVDKGLPSPDIRGVTSSLSFLPVECGSCYSTLSCTVTSILFPLLPSFSFPPSPKHEKAKKKTLSGGGWKVKKIKFASPFGLLRGWVKLERFGSKIFKISRV